MIYPALRCLMLVTYVVITKSTGDSEKISSLCEPAEEGKQTLIVFRENFHKQKISLTVKQKSGPTIAHCEKRGKCDDFFPLHFSTSMAINQNNFDVIITVSVFNTTRSTENYWYLVHQNNKSICEKKVFSRSRGMHCGYNTSKEGLNLWCRSSEIYPQAKCRITETVPNIMKFLPDTMIPCTNKNLSVSSTYYRSNCYLIIALDEILPGKYNMQFTMYPNVTGGDTDVTFGTDYLININLESPRLETDCKNIIEEDTKVTCVCQRSDTSPIHTSIAWIDGANNQMSDTNVLTFNANRQRHNEGFYCVAKNTLGSIIANRFYSPIMRSRSYILTCTKVENDSTFTVTCRTDGLVPFGLCEINLNKTRQMVLNVSKADGGKEIPDNDTLHWSSCAFKITRRDLRQGQNEILVTMYPNITGYDSDKQFCANQSIFINIDHAGMGRDESRNSSFNFWIYVYVVVGNVLIFVIFLGIWWCKQIENTKPDNYYDEINHEPTEAELADYQRCNGYRTLGGKSQDDITEIGLHEEYPKYETVGQWVTQT